MLTFSSRTPSLIWSALEPTSQQRPGLLFQTAMQGLQLGFDGPSNSELVWAKGVPPRPQIRWFQTSTISQRSSVTSVFLIVLLDTSGYPIWPIPTESGEHQGLLLAMKPKTFDDAMAQHLGAAGIAKCNWVSKYRGRCNWLPLLDSSKPSSKCLFIDV